MQGYEKLEDGAEQGQNGDFTSIAGVDRKSTDQNPQKNQNSTAEMMR
jgi:hypothetical protein